MLTRLVHRGCTNLVMCSRKNICTSRHEDNEFLFDITTMQNTRLRKLKKSKLSNSDLLYNELCPSCVPTATFFKFVISNAISSIMSRNYLFMNCIILSILKSDSIHI